MLGLKSIYGREIIVDVMIFQIRKMTILGGMGEKTYYSIDLPSIPREQTPFVLSLIV